MESILYHGNRRKKEKGLTLIETIVALGIIVLISTAVSSIIILSSNALYDTREKSHFVRETSSFASFYLTYDETHFATAVNHVTGLSLEGYDDTTIYYASDYSYSDNTDYKYTLLLDFDENTLTMTVNHQNGEQLYTRSVSK